MKQRLNLNQKRIFLTTIIFVLVAMLLFPAVGFGHDGWAQTNRPIVETGEVVYVELLYGNHSNHHASYRIDGKWNPDTTDIYVIAPSGDRVDISSTLFYTGELQEVSEERLGINNYYIASFSASAPGTYIVVVEGDSTFTSDDVTKRTLRSAKAFTAVHSIPLFHAVRDLDGYERSVSPDRAEFIPQFNPAALQPAEEVRVQLLLKGEPLADTEVSLIRRSTSEAQHFTTDEHGVISFTTGAADYYLLRAKPSTDEALEGEYDQTNYEATMTFVVQNGSGLTLEELTGELSVSGELTPVQAEQGNQQQEASIYLYTTLVLGAALLVTGGLLFRKRAGEKR